jgi:hypothetical protein
MPAAMELAETAPLADGSCCGLAAEGGKMASESRDFVSGRRRQEAGVPRSWDRRYRRWARRAVERPLRGQTSSPHPDTDGIYEAALVAVLAAVLSGAIGLVAVWLFHIGPAAGMVGSAACATLCWWFVARAVRSTEGW